MLGETGKYYHGSEGVLAPAIINTGISIKHIYVAAMVIVIDLMRHQL